MAEQIDWGALMELAKLKRENPEQYQERMEDLKTVMIDIFKILAEVLGEFEEGTSSRLSKM